MAGPKLRPHLTVEPLPTYYERRADSYRFVKGVLEEIFGEPPNAEEIDRTEALFRAAAKTARYEIGLTNEPSSVSLAGDPDLAADLRMMVPVFYDRDRQKLKVWAFLGWTTTSLDVSFETPPKTSRPVPTDGSKYRAAVPVMVEIYVNRLLDRAEMRALCDRHHAVDFVIRALETGGRNEDVNGS